MTTYDISEYWDFVGPKDQPYTATFFESTTFIAQTCKYAWTDWYGGCTRQDDFNPPWVSGNLGNTEQWADSWFVRNDPVRGVVEVADGQQKAGIDRYVNFWKPAMTPVYVTGKEILWGGKAESIGPNAKLQKVQIDYLRSGAFPFISGPWGTCDSYTSWLEHFDEWTDVFGRVHKDVIKVRNIQNWGASSSVDGVDYYCAKGFGRVAAQFFTCDQNLNVISTEAMTAAAFAGGKVLPIPGITAKGV